MKKTIKDFDLKNKKVIIRCDFNVPIKDGKITDDNRIVESLPTILYALENEAKVILLSHLGRIKEEKDKEKYTLKPVADKLSILLNKKVIFVPTTKGEELDSAVEKLEAGEVLLVENTRFEDLNQKSESNNNDSLAEYWASLGDIFINDAFGTTHRNHASNVGIASRLPNGIGFLIEKEIKYLQRAMEKPKRPFTVILGGAKVADKIGVIENLVNIADYILIGGGMAYTFLRASGLPIGKSIVDEESIGFCRELLANYSDKIILPIDGVYARSIDEVDSARECFLSDVKEYEQGLDIGKGTIKIFKQYIEESETIIWNGPLGVFEKEEFSNGTKEIMLALANSSKITIIGGGDTSSAASLFKCKEKFSLVSTGGGASLEMMEGKILPGIGVIDDK